MCNIFGIGLLKDHKIKNQDLLIGLTSILARESMVGGRRATGISLMREKTAHVLKRPIPADEFVKSDEYENFMVKHSKLNSLTNRLTSIIGHARWPTKGSIENNNNNHPIIVNHIIGVHNGIISNDDELFQHHEKDFNRIARVDTEIIFQLLAHFAKERNHSTVAAIEEASKYLEGGYACAVQNANHPYNMYLFRKSNPIRIIILKSLGVVLFATREHTLNRALECFEVSDYEEIELMSEAGIAFNTENRTYSKFTFPRGEI